MKVSPKPTEVNLMKVFGRKLINFHRSGGAGEN
jgi:hypothetical protein